MNELTDDVASLAVAPGPDAPRCDQRNLSVLASANGFTLWHYRVPDGHNVQAEDYFDGCDAIAQGDLVLANAGRRFAVLMVAGVFVHDARRRPALEVYALTVEFSNGPSWPCV